MGTPHDKPADGGGPLYPVRVRGMFGYSSQVSWYKEQENSRPASAPGLWDGH